MKNNDQDKGPLPQQGSGSAENTGQDRAAQINRNVEEIDAASLSDEMGNDSQRMVNLRDLGALSGRDDLSGSTDDGMSEEDTGKPTIR